MARQSRRLTHAYVLDTSYLLELYKVPGHSNRAFFHAIQARLRRAIEADARLYVPFPVIFELANHIAHVVDGRQRTSLANKLSEDIQKSVREGAPWIIAPRPNESVLLELSVLLAWIKEFENRYATQGIGLSDLAVKKQADSLASHQPNFAVHIWTTDRKLKALEPCQEPDAFVGT